jgi:hypothetical protein
MASCIAESSFNIKNDEGQVAASRWRSTSRIVVRSRSSTCAIFDARISIAHARHVMRRWLRIGPAGWRCREMASRTIAAFVSGLRSRLDFDSAFAQRFVRVRECLASRGRIDLRARSAAFAADKRSADLVSDVTKTLGVSMRSLEKGFRDSYQAMPAQYYASCADRLLDLRQDLLNNPATLSPT